MHSALLERLGVHVNHATGAFCGGDREVPRRVFARWVRNEDLRMKWKSANPPA